MVSGIGRQILVVDDDQAILDSCEALLVQHGFKVATCRQSTQAISRLKAGKFDLVVLDIRMPGLEGSDLLPLIKKAQHDLPVIIISAYPDEASRSYYYSLGAFEVFPKPLVSGQLLDAVERGMNHQREIPMVLTSMSLRQGRDQVYRKLILAALTRTHWNQVKAAELLGISRYCLMRWIKKLKISY